jgi:Domain of unknown function (DUF4055)
MPVNSLHPIYSSSIGRWQKNRDVFIGTDAIAAAGKRYLPPISPDQSREEYESYSKRATFFPAVHKTIAGFVGAISRRPHKFTLPPQIAHMEVVATYNDLTLSELTKTLCTEVLLQNRAGLLVDVHDDTGSPYLVPYSAESIINWSDDQIVLKETVFEADPLDRFKLNAVDQFRQLWLNEGVYTCTTWRKPTDAASATIAEWAVYSEVVPTRRGKPLDIIPFTFLSTQGATATVIDPPLAGLVDLSLEHYRKSSDLSHGLYWVAIPTLYITGINEDRQVTLGGGSAILINEAQAKVGMVEFTGAGLGSLEKAISQIEHRMAAVGAGILAAESQRTNITAQEAGIKHASESNLLTSVVSGVRDGLMKALGYAAHWAFSDGKVDVELNDDFVSSRLDGPTLMGLVQALQSDGITLADFQHCLQDGGLLPQIAA